MYTVRFSAYSGCSPLPVPCEDLADARREAARTLRWSRNAGFPVATLTRGESWDIQEPADCAMIPDDCGTLTIAHVTYPCRECGSRCESKDDAHACCAYDPWLAEDCSATESEDD